MYELKTCSVCGAAELKKTGTVEKDGQLFGIYKCHSCDTELSAYDKYLKTVKKTPAVNKNMQKAKEEAAPPPPNEKPNRRAVVNIAADVYKKAIGSTIELVAQMQDGAAQGTGTVISDNGYFITNAHVVAEIEKTDRKVKNFSENVFGQSESHYRFVADVVYIDTACDLALLKTDPDKSLVAVDFCDTESFPGEDVYAIGNSKGEGLCIVEGIVSDIHRKIGGNEHIMISAPVTNGNSGGPVFNSDGKFIGIVRGGHADVSAMNYVIPLSIISDFLEKAKEKEDCNF